MYRVDVRRGRGVDRGNVRRWVDRGDVRERWVDRGDVRRWIDMM